MPLKADIKKQRKGVYVVRLDGRLDTDTYVLFGEQIKPLLNEGTKVLIFDMKLLEYISSIGLGVVFQAQKSIENAGGLFIMTSMQPQIKKIFEVVKALHEKPVFESIEEVDRYLDLVQKKEIKKQQEEI